MGIVDSLRWVVMERMEGEKGMGQRDEGWRRDGRTLGAGRDGDGDRPRGHWFLSLLQLSRRSAHNSFPIFSPAVTHQPALLLLANPSGTVTGYPQLPYSRLPPQLLMATPFFRPTLPMQLLLPGRQFPYNCSWPFLFSSLLLS
ncbi:hypothetical protein AAC387_Pa11g0672 [Persea americana]